MGYPFVWDVSFVGFLMVAVMHRLFCLSQTDPMTGIIWDSQSYALYKV